MAATRILVTLPKFIIPHYSITPALTGRSNTGLNIDIAEPKANVISTVMLEMFMLKIQISFQKSEYS